MIQRTDNNQSNNQDSNNKDNQSQVKNDYENGNKEEKKKDNRKKKKKPSKLKKKTFTVSFIFLILLFMAIPEIITKAIEEQFILFFKDPWGYLQERKEELDQTTNWVFTGYEEYSYEDKLPLSEGQICAILIKELEKETYKQKADIISQAEKIIKDNGYSETGAKISMSSLYTNLPDIPYEYYSKIIAAYSISRPKEELTVMNMLALMGQEMDEHGNVENELKVNMYSSLEYTEHTTQIEIPVTRPILEPVDVWVEATILEIAKGENLRFLKGKWLIRKTLYKDTGKTQTYFEETENVPDYEDKVFTVYSEEEIDGVSMVLTEPQKLYEYIGNITLQPEKKEIKYAVFNCEPIDMKNLARVFGIYDIDAVYYSKETEEDKADTDKTTSTKSTGPTEIINNNTYRDVINTKAEVLNTMMKDTIELYKYNTLDIVPYNDILEMCDSISSQELSGNRKQFIKTALSLQGLVPFEANALPQGAGWNSIWNTQYGNSSGKGLGSIGFIKWALQTTGFEFDISSGCNSLEEFIDSAIEIPSSELQPGDIAILLSPDDDHSITDFNYDTSNTDLNRVGIMATGKYNIVAIFIGEAEIQDIYGSSEKYLLWISCNPVTKQVSLIKTFRSKEFESLINPLISLPSFNYRDDDEQMQKLTSYIPTHFYRISERMEDDDLLTGNIPNYSSYYISNTKTDILLLAKTVDIVCKSYKDLPKQGYDARAAVASVIVNRLNSQKKQYEQLDLSTPVSIYQIIYGMNMNNELFIRGVEQPSKSDITYLINLLTGKADETYQHKTENCINFRYEAKQEMDKILKQIYNKDYSEINTVSLSLRDLTIASDAIKGKSNVLPEDVLYYIYFRFTEEDKHFNSSHMYFNPLTGMAYGNSDGSYLAYWYTSYGDMQFYQVAP